MTQTAITREPVAGRRLKAERLNGARALREAQAPRYRVFSAEFDAKLEGAEDGLDRDDYDRHCAHIGVRDLDSGALVATTRLLDHRAAERLARFYSEEEFHLSGLDALHGPVTYDVTCLYKDAFVSWPEPRVHAALNRYWKKATWAGIPLPPSFEDFLRASDLMGVQRHLKVIGIFARICHRDGKPRYLGDVPRFFRYLETAVARRPELAELGELLASLPQGAEA